MRPYFHPRRHGCQDLSQHFPRRHRALDSLEGLKIVLLPRIVGHVVKATVLVQFKALIPGPTTRVQLESAKRDVRIVVAKHPLTRIALFAPDLR